MKPAKNQFRYDPCSELTNAERVCASNFELLRRIPLFQQVTTDWVGSADFRFNHVCSREPYSTNHPARCVLDWMLTPTERFELATFQKAQRLLIVPDAALPDLPDWNFGPIKIECNWSAYDGRLGDCMDRIVVIQKSKQWSEKLTLERTWKTAPEGFKEQFRRAVLGPSLKQIKLGDIGHCFERMGNGLISKERLTREEQLQLGQFIFRQGSLFRSLDKAFKLVAIPRVYSSENEIDELLAKVKTGLLFNPRTGYDRSSKNSFLGTPDQWRKFLAWEAHNRNPYRAAAEFLAGPDARLARREGERGELSRSEVQRDIASAVRKAVQSIESWFPRLYPIRDLRPPTRQKTTRF